MPNDPAYFRKQAQLARTFSHAAITQDIRQNWAHIAEQFDYLADLAERYGP